jgi:hypothetical protein
MHDQFLGIDQKMAVIAIAFVYLLTAFGCGGGGDANAGNVDNSHASSVESITLNWHAPTTNANGTQLTDLGGYIVHYGPSTANYAYSVDVGNAMGSSFSLTPGTWCFAVTAYDMQKNESNYSSEVCKTV